MDEHTMHIVELIRQYEPEDVQKFPYAAHYVMGIADRKIERMSAQFEQVTRERDALLNDLRDANQNNCEHCKHYGHSATNEQCEGADYMCKDCDFNDCPCRTCAGCSNWQWRGVQEVQHE